MRKKRTTHLIIYQSKTTGRWRWKVKTAYGVIAKSHYSYGSQHAAFMAFQNFHKSMNERSIPHEPGKFSIYTTNKDGSRSYRLQYIGG